MVVVAIIGILAAVAIPNYQKYQARARQSEAKVMLASAYTALQSYFAEVGTYTACLRAIGFESTPGAGGAKRYYTVGLPTFSANTCGPGGTVTCEGYIFDNTGTATTSCVAGANVNFYLATAKVGGGALPVATDLDLDGVSQTQFTVQAVGRISTNPTVHATAFDSWTIDEQKALLNRQTGV
jgi:type IV pilus assembly protein PilA